MEKNNVTKLFNFTNKEEKNLDKFILELKKENLKTNLVGKSTLTKPWDRHICDSAQLTKLIMNKNSTILDIGTGAGLPGLVLAILGYNNITMIDSKNKKIKFVNNIITKLDLKSKTIHSRLEYLSIPPFQYIVSRAVAPLHKLLNYSLFFSNRNTTLVFLKGRNVNKEIVEAKKYYFFEHRVFKSISSGEGYMIKITGFRKK